MARSKRAVIDKRAQGRLSAAIAALEAGAPVRAAASKACLPPTTLHRKYQKWKAGSSSSPQLGRPRGLSDEEEKRIVTLMKRYSDRGHPLRRSDVLDAVGIIVSDLPPERRGKLQFKHGRPGPKFLRGFLTRHKADIRLGRASKQEAARFTATNAEALTAHFLNIEELIKENKIDATRMCNLDEAGCTPAREAHGHTRHKVYITRSQSGQQRSPEFKNVRRITILGVIFANGYRGYPMFVVEGTSIRYRLLSDGQIETLADCLPRHSTVTTRETVAGVDKSNLLRWATGFAEEVKDLTAGGRKVLLVYDGYRSHMGVAVLEVLSRGGIIAYALPAHTSGSTQPLDLAVFGPFKHHLNDCVHGVSSSTSTSKYDVFDFCKMMSVAYELAFTPENIRAGFRKAGLWPLSAAPLIAVPRPTSLTESTIMSTNEMESLLEKKRTRMRNSVGINIVAIKRGFIDTSRGVNLTSDSAMELARAREAQQTVKSATKRRKTMTKAAKEAQQFADVRAARQAQEMRAVLFRVENYNAPNVLPRPMFLRRKLAARRQAEKRAERATKLMSHVS